MMTTQMHKSIHQGASLAAWGITLILALMVSTPAQAQLNVVECATGNQNQTYTPPITLVSKPVAISGTGQYSACVALDDPSLNFGDFTIFGSGTASCLVANLPTTNVITWNDGSTSTVVFSGGVDVKPPGVSVVVITGTVTAGRYTNYVATKTLVLASLPDLLACLSSGIQYTSGPVSLTLTQL
ncbi:hypothetical protein JGU66_28550 [Myxococcaceae bacterium JPH2]|nr:hypothetical protein [Myxococcaceae bacterium JPH2]